MIHPINIIEIGTYARYSALCMAEGLKNNGILHTIDINEEYTSIARRYFDSSIYSRNIKQYIGNAINISAMENIIINLLLLMLIKKIIPTILI